MSKIWRWVAPISIAGTIMAGTMLPAQAAPSAYAVTLAATSPNYPGASHGKVDGFALVVFGTRPSVYHWPKNWSIATIAGTVTGAAAGDVATLFARPFGAKSYASTGMTRTLASTGTDKYSFTVKPRLATSYRVEVQTGTTTDATSPAQTVYVTLAPIPSRVRTHCASGRCKITALLKVLVPASAYRTESRKHWYFYFNLDTRLPRLPKYLSLDRSASASHLRRLNSGEFEITATIPFSTHVSNPARFAIWTGCTKDAVTKDGIGLPGRHGCGASRVRFNSPYIG